MSDVICENCSKLSGKNSKSNVERHESVLKPPMNLRISFQSSEYNAKRDEYSKNKPKMPFHHNIPCLLGCISGGILEEFRVFYYFPVQLSLTTLPYSTRTQNRNNKEMLSPSTVQLI